MGGSLALSVLRTLTEIAFRREFHAFLGRADQHRIAHDAHVAADARELAAGHFDRAGVVGVGNAQMLAVQVHQAQFVVSEFILICKSTI